MVILKDYYTATLLAQLKAWFPMTKLNRWTELESSQIPGHSLYHLLLTGQFNILQYKELSPRVLASLQDWHLLITSPFHHSTSSSMPLPIQYLTSVIPDLNIGRWVARGIGDIADLMVGPAPKPFVPSN